PGPPPPAAAGAPWVGIDWERWFGVRAAAVLGGVALALAGLLFFKYSIEHGLIPPWLRVVIGTLVGVGCIAGSERTLRPRYAGTANALAGAGVVVLYAAFWAASVHYGLVGIPVSFVLMVAVTAACCALSWRHASQVIALLGLVGGFATPLLLASGAHRPVGLFGYVLLLDLGLLVLARQRRWPDRTGGEDVLARARCRLRDGRRGRRVAARARPRCRARPRGRHVVRRAGGRHARLRRVGAGARGRRRAGPRGAGRERRAPGRPDRGLDARPCRGAVAVAGRVPRARRTRDPP